MAGRRNFLVHTSSQKSANKIIYKFTEPEIYLNTIQKFNLYLTEHKLCLYYKEQSDNGNGLSLFRESHKVHTVCGKTLKLLAYKAATVIWRGR
jgi:hypothetical protein